MKYFGPFHDRLRGAELQAQINPKSIVRYGQFRMARDGDKMCTANLIDKDPIAHDNSFVKVHALII
jgi:hypothetical protein